MKTYYSRSPYSYIEQVSNNLFNVYDRISGTRYRFTFWFHAMEKRKQIASKYSKVKTTHTI